VFSFNKNLLNGPENGMALKLFKYLNHGIFVDHRIMVESFPEMSNYLDKLC
jgi:hypothetical protein